MFVISEQTELDFASFLLIIRWLKAVFYYKALLGKLFIHTIKLKSRYANTATVAIKATEKNMPESGVLQNRTSLLNNFMLLITNSIDTPVLQGETGVMVNGFSPLIVSEHQNTLVLLKVCRSVPVIDLKSKWPFSY